MAKFNIKNVVRLWTEASRDSTAIHAELADGTVRHRYRVHDSDLAAELTITRLARENGMTVRIYRGYELEATKVGE